MAKVNLYRGGTAVPLFPACLGPGTFEPPFPRKVAGEYDRGYFTLGLPLHPSLLRWQEQMLDGAKVGDILDMLVIPEKTLFNGIYAEVDPHPATSGVHIGGSCIASVGEGFAAEIVMQKYNNDTQQTEPFDMASDGDDASEDDDPTPVPSGAPVVLGTVTGGTFAVNWYPQPNGGLFVPPNQTLVIGLRVTSLPTDGSTLANMGGRTVLVAKVEDFQFPWHM